MCKKVISKNQMRTLCLLCCFVYFVSYLTRLNYAVCMVEIQKTLQISKNIAGLPVTASFLSYGAGQIICGFLGDKHRPQKMILMGITGTTLCNLLVVFLPRIEIMIPAWFINGFFQSMLWPPLVRIMAENLDEDWYRRGCVWVSLSSSGATVALYLTAPLFIQAAGWKTVFYLAIFAGFTAVAVWCRSTRKLFEGSGAGETGARRQWAASPKEKADIRLFGGVPIVSILMAIVLHGMLKDGITTWMPVYMAEMFGMSSSQSILSTAVLPICSVFSTLFSSVLLYRLKNEVLTAALLFGMGTIAGISMLPAYDSYPAICVVMMMIITGCMYGINLMLISRVPGHFAGRGNVSTVSGILNAATYMGSALSIYVFGAVAENMGWMAVVAIWGAVAMAGILFLALGIRKWAGFCAKQKSTL